MYGTKKLIIANDCASSCKTFADELPVVKLPHPSEPQVPLSAKRALSTSVSETNSMQNVGTENSTTQNSSVFVFQGSELCESSNFVLSGTVPYPSFIAQNGGTFVVSEATQTDLMLQKDTIVQNDSSGCVRSAIETLSGLYKHQSINPTPKAQTPVGVTTSNFK